MAEAFLKQAVEDLPVEGAGFHPMPINPVFFTEM
jgi:hypothetical protein